MNKPGMGNLNVIEACLVENHDDKWIVDSGATNHVCYSLQWFKHSLPVSKGQRDLKLGTEELVSALAVGQVILSFDNYRTLVLEDCLFIPDFKMNLIFVSCLDKHDLTVQFNSSVSIRSSSSFICSSVKYNGLYFLSPVPCEVNHVELKDVEHIHSSKK